MRANKKEAEGYWYFLKQKKGFQKLILKSFFLSDPDEKTRTRLVPDEMTAMYSLDKILWLHNQLSDTCTVVPFDLFFADQCRFFVRHFFKVNHLPRALIFCIRAKTIVVFK